MPNAVPNPQLLSEIDVPAGVKAIVLDAHGTVIAPVESVAMTYSRFGAEYGNGLTIEELDLRIQSAFRCADWTDASQSGQWSTWKAIVRYVFDAIDASNFERLFQELWDHYARPLAWRVFPDVAETLLRWQSAKFQLAIGSNFDDRIQSVVSGFRELDPCRHVFWSAQIGHAKPDPRFFHSIRKVLACEPQECLMIGDLLQKDVQGAQRAGWQAIHLVRNA